MCSITGLLDKNGEKVASILVQMLQQTSHRGPDGCGIYVDGLLKKAPQLEELKTEGLKGASGLGHSRLKITGSAGIQPLWSCDTRFVLAFNGEIWNYKELRGELIRAGHVFESDSDSEVIIHLVEENHKKSQSLDTSLLQTCKRLDGEYAFAVFDNVTKMVAMTRDPVGIKQLYFGQNSKYLAFCSEKKPLWDIGIEPQRVRPGEIVKTSFDESVQNFSFEKRRLNVLTKPTVDVGDERDALERYKQVLFDAVKKRIDGKDSVGIIFSGGIDSVLIAKIAKILFCDITCYTSGFKNSSDIIAATQSSKELGIKLVVHELNQGEIESELGNIISAIESSNHLQVDVAIPVFFAVKEAKKDQMRVMLTGQGADEIFAGYDWYPKIYKERGDDVLGDCLWNDIENLYKDTLEREDKIAMYHSIELRVPYLDPQVIDVAMSIPGDLKIKNNHVKYLHRKLAQEIGVPPQLAWRKKEAAQHGSNVHDNLITVMKKIKESIADDTPSPKHDESLGSAYRYSYDRYEENDAVQKTLDILGEKLGLHPKTT